MNAREKKVAFDKSMEHYENALNIMFWLENNYDYRENKKITAENRVDYEKRLIREKALTQGIELCIKASPDKCRAEFYKKAFELKDAVIANQNRIKEEHNAFMEKVKARQEEKAEVKTEEKTENTAA